MTRTDEKRWLIPKKIHDGDWWTTKHLVEVECVECDRVMHDRPTVMRYCERRDIGSFAARQYPWWPQDGWLVWWDCEHCGWQDHKTSVTDEQVAEWGKEYGPWRKLGEEA